MDKLLIIIGVLGLFLVGCFLINDDENKNSNSLTKEEIAEVEKRTAAVISKKSISEQKAELARIEKKLSEAKDGN